MSAAHTPGPWAVGTNSATRASVYAGGVMVAFAREEFSRINGTQAEANARVIAATPDLLALAYQYRNDLNYPPAADSRERRLSAIAAIIARATGAE